MIKYVDYYKLERISSRMAKEFGTIPKGYEEQYRVLLDPMEGNLLKLHRKNPDMNGRYATEAIKMCLLKVDGYIRGVDYDFSRFVNDENQAFLNGLLASFDPFTNREIYDIVNKSNELEKTEGLKGYFKLPIKCLLRIEKSIDLWTEQYGNNGYFEFIEDQIGHLFDNTDKMNFAVRLQEDDMKKFTNNPSNFGVDCEELE
ncbi:MAG: hypothetical protein Q7S39_01545 [Ignavibacteria bacterium]|nr:hypothetical protein [Ignavibacteria bacterium]